MNVNATHRLHRVVDIDETRPDTRGATPSATPSAAPAASALPAAAAPPPAAEADPESARRKLERICLRAEREGPKGWVQVLPQIQEHLDRFPKHAEAWAYKARARMAQGDQTDALRAAREAVRLDPEIVLGHALSLLVARNCADIGRWEQVAPRGGGAQLAAWRRRVAGAARQGARRAGPAGEGRGDPRRPGPVGRGSRREAGH